MPQTAEAMANSADTHDARSSTLVAEEQTIMRGSRNAVHHIPSILPHERVFPIQVGSELFKLSGASISSDGV